MARKPLPKSFGKPRGLVVVVAKPDRVSGDRMRGERLRGGDGHKLGGRPHAADSRRDLGRDPMKSDRSGDFLKRDSRKG
ncbi:MAG TPA: hypothetical protein VKW08_15075 [Xanthobacteraceae bacterium]|nr:hypothetical protein [Xanthobacteraceae bacterium]